MGHYEELPEWSPEAQLVDAHVCAYSRDDIGRLLGEAGMRMTEFLVLPKGYQHYWEATR